jgi:hypothetical protein
MFVLARQFRKISSQSTFRQFSAISNDDKKTGKKKSLKEKLELNYHLFDLLQKKLMMTKLLWRKVETSR